jgi:hypothetical protein
MLCSYGMQMGVEVCVVVDAEIEVMSCLRMRSVLGYRCYTSYNFEYEALYLCRLLIYVVAFL